MSQPRGSAARAIRRGESGSPARSPQLPQAPVGGFPMPEEAMGSPEG